MDARIRPARRDDARCAHDRAAIRASCALPPVGTNDIYAVPSISDPPAAAAPASSDAAAPAAAAAVAATGVGLDLDDYLLGLTSLPKELVRLCVNCVRTGNYVLPGQISSFISDLYSGFRLLNLRNDALRRRFDAIKYDVAKVEEVLYDCTVRGLGVANAGNNANATVNAASKPLAVAAGDADVTMQ